jgi:hypothetical protein
MNTTDIVRRLDAMERRANAMQTIAEILLSQVEQQRRDIASLKAITSKETVEAPSLVEMLRAHPAGAKPR